MTATVISIVTDVSRFWFLLITVYILFRLIDNSLSEYSFRKEMLTYGPGQIFGELTVQPASATKNGPLKPPVQRYGLKWENTIGSNRLCDVCVEDKQVAKRHAVLYMAKGQAYISPLGRAEVQINGKPAEKGEEVFDGDVLTLGGTKLRLNLYTEEEEA